jgi:conjugative relaxase-like TrwC/TraI family protein
VLSVAKLTPGQESYYERSVAAGLDDYYAGKGESPGEWAGSGAAGLGLESEVADGELGSLIRGRHPTTGEDLRPPVKARTIKVERIDPESGKRWLEEKKLAPVAGLDLVFSTPKSVSLLHALADEETRAAVAEAHCSAWRAALAYLEAEACVTRRGKDGYLRERGEGFVAAAYQHRTSRAQDPHLHTHVIVANMTRCPSDGEWRALDGEALLKTYRLAAGYLYEAHLRSELSRRLGVEWETPQKGWAELKGVPRAVVEAFSTRRAQVVEHLAVQGTSGFYVAQVAAVASRERKEEVDLPRLREEWAARAAEHGLGRRELTHLLHRGRYREPTPAELVAHAERLLGPEGLTEKRSTFSEPDLVMAWADAFPQGARAERVRALASRLLELPGVERVSEPPPPGKAARYSTSELLRVERKALALVERGRHGGAPAVEGDLIDVDVAFGSEPISLSAEQERVVRRLVESPSRVVCVVGPAGSGKTSALRVAAEAFAAEGVPALGAAPSGIAAERLQDESGIPSTTLHRLLAAARRQGGLPHRSVLVVDEAGMAETRVLAPLLALVEEAEGKAVLVGDPRQLPAVGAGGLFAAIVEREGALELRDSRRQRDELERRALAAVRAGAGRDYLAHAEQKGRLVIGDDPVDAKARLLADWWQAASHDLQGNVMIALRRADVADLNAAARTLMEAEGRLGTERLEVVGVDLAVGDRIVCRRNSQALGVRNGTRGTVADVDLEGGCLTVATDRGDSVELPQTYLEAGHVQHAYALTGHAAQGLTVERAFVLGPERGRLREWSYVALSRAREQTRLYVTEPVGEEESHFHELDDRDPLTRLAQALEESAQERLASEQRPPPAGPVRASRPVIARRTPEERELASACDRLRRLESVEAQTKEAKARSEQRLAAATERLAGLGWRGRRREGERLRREAAREQSALRLAEEKLASLERERGRARRRLARAQEAAPRPPRERARAVERPAPERAPERQLGLDLGL